MFFSPVFQIHQKERDRGSILVFLPGREEIESTYEVVTRLEFDKKRGRLEVATLYAGRREVLSVL